MRTSKVLVIRMRTFNSKFSMANFQKSNILLNYGLPPLPPLPPPQTSKIDLKILKNCHHTLLKQVAKV